MPGYEIDGNVILPHILEELREIGLRSLDTAVGGTSYLQLREAFLEMFGCDGVELVELFDGPSPGARLGLPSAGGLVEVGLVPDLPVLDIIVETVGPAFIVVEYDVFAYSRPFLVIFRRIDVVLGGLLVLDGLPETVEGFAAGIDQGLDVGIGLPEIVRGGLVRILAEIREHLADIYQPLPVVSLAGIVGTAVGNIQDAEIGHLGAVADVWPVVDRIHRFDRTYDDRVVHGYAELYRRDVRLGVLGV